MPEPRGVRCFAARCKAVSPDGWLGCYTHWPRVPRDHADQMLALWRRDKPRGEPSAEYVEAARLARLLVRQHEARAGPQPTA